MLTAFEKSYEKTVAVDVDFNQQVLTILKTVVIEQADALPEIEKGEISTKISSFLTNELEKEDISIENPQELSLFLIKHFALIKPLLAICHHARNQMGEKANLRLKLDIEHYDESHYSHPVLYIKTDIMTREVRQKIRELDIEFSEPFMDEGVSFGCRPDIL